MKNSFYIVLLLSIFFFTETLRAQSILSGTIRDSDSKEPLYGTLVRVLGQENLVSVSDFEGQYRFELEPGEYSLEFSYIGYPSLERQIILKEGIQNTLDIDWEAGLSNEVVVVTESRSARRLEESTVSVDVITPKMLENNNITSLDQALAKTSGVQMMDGQISIRGGAGFAFGAGSRVSFLVDGQLLLSAELSDVKWNFIPIENAEQIEIIKGSASVLYGSGALNGVVHVRTASPKADKPFSSVTAYAGMYDGPGIRSMNWQKDRPIADQPMFYGGFFAHRQKLGADKNFDLVLGGNFHIENSFIYGADERRFRFNLATKYRPEKHGGRLSYGINANTMYHEIGTYFLPPNMRDQAFSRIDGTGADRYFSLTIDPHLTYIDNSANKHDIRARWFTISKRRRPSVSSMSDLVSLEYNFQRELRPGMLLTAGSMLQHFGANSILFAGDDDPDLDRVFFGGQSVAFFGQLENKFFDNRLQTTVGLRWEGFQIDTAFTPTPPILRLAANYALSPRNHLRASFGQGFRFPSLAERFIDESLDAGAINLRIIPNVDLKPEIGWSSELAYRHSFRNEAFRFYFDAALFWMQYENMVEFRFDFFPQGAGFRTINVSEARIAGWEFSAQADGHIGKFPLRVWGGYTYNYAVDMQADSTQKNVGLYLNNMFTTFVRGVDRENPEELNRLLKYRSLHTVRMDIETDIRKFTFGIAANYNSFVHAIDDIFELEFIMPGMREFREQRLRGNLIFDARVAYRINEEQRIIFTLNNMFNSVYASRPARMGAPRSFVVKYNQRF